MRMGTFLFGGLLGAFAVVYINRNNGMMMSNLANAGQSVGNMVNKAKSKLSNMNMDMGFTTSNNKTNTTTQSTNSTARPTNAMSQQSSTTNQANSSNPSLAQVEQFANQDPNVKKKVDEILAENKQTTSAYGMQ
jgi:Sec-independent protein translocase protein TatA